MLFAAPLTRCKSLEEAQSGFSRAWSQRWLGLGEARLGTLSHVVAARSLLQMLETIGWGRLKVEGLRGFAISEEDDTRNGNASYRGAGSSCQLGRCRPSPMSHHGLVASVVL